MDAIVADTGIELHQLKVDGGASANGFLMQFQADILQKQVYRPKIRETTALGAAYLAGLATGVWSGREEIRKSWICDNTFEPRMTGEESRRLMDNWHKAVGRSRGWAK